MTAHSGFNTARARSRALQGRVWFSDRPFNPQSPSLKCDDSLLSAGECFRYSGVITQYRPLAGLGVQPDGQVLARVTVWLGAGAAPQLGLPGVQPRVTAGLVATSQLLSATVAPSER
jgi:hypothetical protein